MYLNDSDTALAVLVDRAEGASSLQDGALELLLHRRLLCQDACGFENLNETDAAVYRDGDLVQRLGRGLIVTGRHQLIMGAPSAVRVAVRLQQQSRYAQLHPVFAATATGESAEQWRAQGRVGQLSFLQTPLPRNVELMTLQVLFDGSILLRLAHSFAIGETSDELSQPVAVDLSTLFVQPIKSIRQRTLTANADYKRGAKVRPAYETTAEVSEEEWERVDRMHEGLQANLTVTIYPMQILTFQLTFN